jgi:hypothetical protein
VACAAAELRATGSERQAQREGDTGVRNDAEGERDAEDLNGPNRDVRPGR